MTWEEAQQWLDDSDRSSCADGGPCAEGLAIKLAETRKVFARFCQRAASVPTNEALEPIEDSEIVRFHATMPRPR